MNSLEIDTEHYVGIGMMEVNDSDSEVPLKALDIEERESRHAADEDEDWACGDGDWECGVCEYQVRNDHEFECDCMTGHWGENMLDALDESGDEDGGFREVPYVKAPGVDSDMPPWPRSRDRGASVGRAAGSQDVWPGKGAVDPFRTASPDMWHRWNTNAAKNPFSLSTPTSWDYRPSTTNSPAASHRSSAWRSTR